MQVWNKCQMVTLYSNCEGDSMTCDVRIDGPNIVVSYVDQDGSPVTYEGTDKGNGHFELRMEGGGGHASLHRFPGSTFLEGWWSEDGVGQGAWRIILPMKSSPEAAPSEVVKKLALTALKKSQKKSLPCALCGAETKERGIFFPSSANKTKSREPFLIYGLCEAHPRNQETADLFEKKLESAA